MKQISLLRHAKSDWGEAGLTDYDRPLNERGHKAATHMGQWMKHCGIKPDFILSSPAMRAKQTIELVCKEIQFNYGKIQWDKRMYLASPKALLELISFIPASVQHALLVGHNPGLEELLLHLTGGDIPKSKSGKLMATATLAQLELAQDFQDITQLTKQYKAKLVNIYWPKQLPSF